jgi:hypothetical protein
MRYVPKRAVATVPLARPLAISYMIPAKAQALENRYEDYVIRY